MNKEELNAEIKKLRGKVLRIEEKENRELAQSLVGKCFVYKNTYGHGKSWPLYAKVYKMERFGSVMVKQIQIDPQGRGTWEIRSSSPSYMVGGGWHPIKPSRYEAAWRRFQRNLILFGAKK